MCGTKSHSEGPKVARKPMSRQPLLPALHDGPWVPLTPTFLDQLIKGISYLDRSTNTFTSNYPKSLNLPGTCSQLPGQHDQLPSHLDHLDHASPMIVPTTAAERPPSDYPATAPPCCRLEAVNAVHEYVDNSANTSCFPVSRARTSLPSCPRAGG